MSHTFFFMSNPACDYVTERGVKVSVPAQLWLVSTWCWKQIWKVSFSNFSLTIVDLFFFPQICSVILLTVSKSVKVLIQSASTLLQVIRTTFHWCSSIKPTTESEDHQSQLGLIIRELWIFHSDPHQRSVDHRTKSWQKVDKKWTKSGQRTGQLQFTVAGCCCHIFDQQRMKRNVFTNTYEPRISIQHFFTYEWTAVNPHTETNAAYVFVSV